MPNEKINKITQCLFFDNLPDDVEYNFEEGLVVGKFAPLTNGHINLINKAATACKKLTVAMCFDEKFLSQQNERDQKILTRKNRMIWLKKTFKNMPHINIVEIDETNLPAYPNGWAGYANLVRGIYPNSKIPEGTAIFSSEIEYDENYKKYLPELTHVVFDNDRVEVPISATMIRNNLYKYWEMLPTIVREYYTLKVCIVGTESSGKTTLVRALAKRFCTSWVEEYGREYCLNEVGGSEKLLVSKDYEQIVFNHKAEERKAIKSANKVTFIDSNAFVTEFYHRLYEGFANPTISGIVKSEEYDLIIYMSDETTWHDDGLRVNKDNRNQTKELFEEMLEEFPNQKEKMKFVSGVNIRQRHNKATDFVLELLKTNDA